MDRDMHGERGGESGHERKEEGHQLTHSFSECPCLVRIDHRGTP